jgi:hypothetical protein
VSFDLRVEPWIPVVTASGRREEVGLRDALVHAHALRGVEGDGAPQTAALLRLLLAVVYRASSVTAAPAYLDRWAGRFDLLGEEAPFMQISGLTGRVVPPTELIADSVMYPAQPAGMSLPEAARWLVTVHAYSRSGIRPASSGDPRVQKGKSYSTTAAPVDRVIAWVEGATLADTLALCRTPHEAGIPVWEHPPVREHVDRVPTGAADVLTWQSRRVRLHAHGGRVTAAVISNGQRLPETGDPMVAYRMDRKGKPLRTHAPIDREAWALTGALLSPETVWSIREHVAARVHTGTLDPAIPVRVCTIDPATDVYRARIDDLRPETTTVPAGALLDPARETGIITATRDGVRAYAKLRHAIADAGGRVTDTQPDLTSVLADIAPTVAAALAGAVTAPIIDTIRDAGRWEAEHASEKAWIGRRVTGPSGVEYHVSTPEAEARFYRELTLVRESMPQ